MRIEFEYTMNDLREGIWWRRRARAAVAVLGWLVVLECGAVALWLEKSHQTTINVRRDWADLIPWVAVPLVIVLVRLSQLRRQAIRVWASNPAFHLPQSVEIDQQGVKVASSLLETRYHWNYFVGWAQTPNLLLLLIPGDVRLIVPKRAFPGSAGLSECRALIDAQVQKPTRGFPVGSEFKAAESATSQSEVNTSSAGADRSGARHQA